LNRKFDVRILTTVKTNNDPVFSDLNYSDKTQLLASQLEVYLIEFPFFDNKFSLKKMSISLHISENDITNYLQTSLKTNFTDWKNGLRINQAIKLINSGQSNFMTIQGIAQSVGILSRSKFIDLFKKQMGMTPSEYIKNR
jgi:AraC-like DNA-binding protein